MFGFSPSTSTSSPAPVAAPVSPLFPPAIGPSLLPRPSPPLSSENSRSLFKAYCRLWPVRVLKLLFEEGLLEMGKEGAKGGSVEEEEGG